MSAQERAYQLLMRAYPEEFRGHYAHQMAIVFRDLRREGWSGVRLWMFIIGDTVRSAPSLRIEKSRRRPVGQSHPKGGIMKTMAILAVVVGALTIVNSTLEGWTGGVVSHDGLSFVVWGLGALAGVSIVAAGVLLLRRSDGAMTLAQAAALACLAAFVLMLLVSPRLSVFANILGIGFPALLIAYVQLRRGNGRPAPMAG